MSVFDHDLDERLVDEREPLTEGTLLDEIDRLKERNAIQAVELETAEAELRELRDEVSDLRGQLNGDRDHAGGVRDGPPSPRSDRTARVTAATKARQTAKARARSRRNQPTAPSPARSLVAKAGPYLPGEPIPARVEAKLYRYMGIVVRVLRGHVEPVRVFGVPVTARRASSCYAPLPKAYRRQVRRAQKQAKQEARRQRLEAQGVEIVETPFLRGGIVK
jgi:hypothetical protein